MKYNEIGKFFCVKVLRKLFLKTNLILCLQLMTYDVNAQVIIGDTMDMEYHSLNILMNPGNLYNGTYASSNGRYLELTKDTTWDILLEASQRETISSKSGKTAIVVFNYDFEVASNPLVRGARKFHELNSLHSSLFWHRCTEENFERILLSEFTDSVNLSHSGMWYNSNSPIDGFVGFRIAGPIDTLYGWIHLVSTMSISITPFATLYIKDWAIQKFPSRPKESVEPIAIDIAPNPFMDHLNIFVESNHQFQIKIYDVTSKLIFKNSFIKFETIRTENFAKGIYLYEITNSLGFRKTGKIAKT